MKIKFLVLVLLLIGIITGGYWYYRSRQNDTFISPFLGANFWPFSKPKNIKVIGFLPYWNIKDGLRIDPLAIDELIYFSLLADENGELIKMQNGGLEPGWRDFNSDKVTELLLEAKKRDIKIGISFAAFDLEIVPQIVDMANKRTKLVSTISKITKDYDLDHINIDFEYFLEDGDPEFGKNFNLFLQELRQQLDLISPDIVLSADIYPRAVVKGLPYELPEMMQIIDKLIIMAYDFTQQYSEFVGPVAPLYKNDVEKYCIVNTLASTFGRIESQKVVLGIPLYGYEWATQDGGYRAETVSSAGVTASYKRVKQLIKDKELLVNWDATASSPWLVYEDAGQTKQIYFENLESLKLKIEMAKQLDLNGIAFWALGYEGDNRELWEYIKSE